MEVFQNIKSPQLYPFLSFNKKSIATQVNRILFTKFVCVIVYFIRWNSSVLNRVKEQTKTPLDKYKQS